MRITIYPIVIPMIPILVEGIRTRDYFLQVHMSLHFLSRKGGGGVQILVSLVSLRVKFLNILEIRLKNFGSKLVQVGITGVNFGPLIEIIRKTGNQR